jgi:hypothetical protein
MRLGGGDQHDGQCGDEGKVDALGEPVMACVVVFSAVCLCNEGVEAEHEADAEERRHVEDRISDRDSSDGSGTQAADHDGVDDALRHPAQFAEDDGNGERGHGAEFACPIGLGCGVRHFSTVTGWRVGGGFDGIGRAALCSAQARRAHPVRGKGSAHLTAIGTNETSFPPMLADLRAKPKGASYA